MKCLFLLLFGFMATAGVAQKYTISGYVSDATTGEKLIGANVYDRLTFNGTSTNTYGFYSLTMPADSVELVVSYIGYTTQTQTLVLEENMEINIALSPTNELEAVVVTSERTEAIENRTQMSSVSIPVEQIKKIPAFMGEVDIIKVLQLMPGVQSGGEGSSGMYVRGGSPDQNLVLLDGVPVYNVSHLFGFFSVFNADAINHVQLIKGGFPARYGGRLSSVLEINMKEGNMKEFHGEGTVGLVASKLTLEGPIVKDKASFIISGRRTYIDLLARPIIKKAMDGGVAGYYFYDLNGKVNWKLSNKDRLYLSAYTGDDKFHFRMDEEYRSGPDHYKNSFGGRLRWGNITSVLRWNHQYGPKLFSNVTLNYTKYQFETAATDEQTVTYPNDSVDFSSFNLRYFSGIKDWSSRIDFDYVPSPDHYIKFGVSGTYHTFEPGATEFEATQSNLDLLDTMLSNDNIPAYEFAAYIEDDIRFTSQLKANIGLHASAFVVDGRFYKSLQPRISARYLLTPDLSLKASYAHMVQYIHLLSNSGIGLPTDLWVPATDMIRPERSWQAALGAARTFADNYEISVEGYYKEMQNIIEYLPGESYLNSFKSWEEKVAAGKGWSYGAELFLQRKSGRLTGWIGYTLSWTNRRFEGTDINFGETFPYRFDRRHDISVVGMYKISDKVEFAATWVYGTGNSVTLPLGYYPSVTDDPFGWGGEVEYISERNGFRMPAYHRLDVGFSFPKKTKWGERVWNISAYNTYNRKNPFFIYATDAPNGATEFRQVSLFPIIPSVSYSFKF